MSNKSKEKAIELYQQFGQFNKISIGFHKGTFSKQKTVDCAMILVDQVIEENKLFPYNTIFYERIIFWKEVKVELENILKGN